MPTIYPSLAIGAARRLAIFRAEAADPKCHWVRPMTWRDVRFATLKSRNDSGKGLQDGNPVWCSFDRHPLRRESRADEIVSMRHTGYYTDTYCNETAFGVIFRLPHGRILAGYRWTENDETVIFPEIHDDEKDAARTADGHAESFAEKSREDSERFDEARKLEDSIEDNTRRLRECITLRHTECMRYVRDEITSLCTDIRNARCTLRTEFADYT